MKKLALEIEGREIVVTNPDKVFFPRTGHTKIDLVNYYLAVADGALRGVYGRPMAMKRFVNGAEGTPFFQKRAPESRPDWIETIELSYPSGRTADEIVVRDAAQLAWVINLGCIDLNPHPVRAEDVDQPDELRVDLDPVRGVAWPQVREVALVARAVLEDFGLVGCPAEGIDSTVGSLEGLLELAERQALTGVAEAPAPGNVPLPAPGKAVGPTGRRRTTAPLIEIARAAAQDEAFAGLERWKLRHADVWS